MSWLRGLIASGVRNPVFCNVLMLCILIGGLASARDLVSETYPEFSLNRITVEVVYPGANPLEVERGVVTKVEEALEGFACTVEGIVQQGEIIWSLRSIAMLAKRLPCDLAASTGVHDANGLIKQLLAGATAVQACSTFYLNGLENVKPMLEGLRSWMQRHDLHNLDEVRDRMQPELSEKPEIRERLQYIKMFGGVE